MRLVLLLVSAGVLIGTAGAAHADVDAKDQTFLTTLNQAGVTYMSPTRAVSAGKSVCDLVDSGMTGYEIVQHLQDSNPGFQGDGAAKFAAIAAQVYCPQALTVAENQTPPKNSA